jgi:hypothetical protein
VPTGAKSSPRNHYFSHGLCDAVVEDKPHKPVKRNSGPAHPLVLPDDDEGAMVTCCGAQENKKTKGREDKVVLTPRPS